ncbi:MAG: hypothetical protein GY928_03670 [Colwellia sp.]|nr:hypothetical protein [Colwellia sp.]
MSNTANEIDLNKVITILKGACAIDRADRLAAFDRLESFIFSNEQLPIPVIHRFSGGIYSREITIPQYAILTGKIHKFDHFDVMIRGDIMVSSDDGEVKRLTGYNVMEGKAGKKRAGVALEETTWVNFHNAEERDPEEMADYITVNTFAEYDVFKEQFSLAMAQLEKDERILTDLAQNVTSKYKE